MPQVDLFGGGCGINEATLPKPWGQNATLITQTPPMLQVDYFLGCSIKGSQERCRLIVFLWDAASKKATLPMPLEAQTQTTHATGRLVFLDTASKAMNPAG